MSERHEFDKPTKATLAARVGNRCSNPQCRAPTHGPTSDPKKASSVGVAAHICAASRGGPRFDPNQTEEERRSIENGIWLCSIHAKKIDDDPARFTVERLQAWKLEAEAAADDEQGRAQVAAATGSLVQQSEVSLIITPPADPRPMPRRDKPSTGQIHYHEYRATLRNTGKARIDDWMIDVEFPKVFLESGLNQGGYDERRSAKGQTAYFTRKKHSSDPDFMPNREFYCAVSYVVTTDLYYRHQELYPLLVIARAYVNGFEVAEDKRTIESLVNF